MQPTISQEDGMKRFRIGFFTALCVIFCIFLLQNGLAQNAAALEVTDAAICTGVENRACVDPKEEFSSGVDRLYCFARITGAKDDTEQGSNDAESQRDRVRQNGQQNLKDFGQHSDR